MGRSLIGYGVVVPFTEFVRLVATYFKIIPQSVSILTLEHACTIETSLFPSDEAPDFSLYDSVQEWIESCEELTDALEHKLKVAGFGFDFYYEFSNEGKTSNIFVGLFVEKKSQKAFVELDDAVREIDVPSLFGRLLDLGLLSSPLGGCKTYLLN